MKQPILLFLSLLLYAPLAFSGSVQVIQTSAEGARLKELPSMTFTADDSASLPTITVNPAVTFQTIIGFGGAFTESTASVLNQLPKNKREEIINAYFSPKGAAYTLCRTPIGSCDFSLSSYSYDETPGDTSLKNFSIDHDKAALLPLIKDAMAVPGASFKMLSSPWTPPSWMTSQNRLVAKYNHLKPEFYKTYADYIVKYVQAYAGEGITISYMTAQNEAWNDSGAWETTQFSPQETAGFVKALGATFEANKIATKIMVYDHNKGLGNDGKYQVKSYVDQVYSDAEAKKYVWGAGFHWYGNTQKDPFGDPKATHEAYPDKHLIHTEACAEGGSHIDDYPVGERYGHDIIGCLNNWTEGWIDWNMVLDANGGPNHANNYCSAPVLVGLNSGKVLYNPSYYYLAHFSKYFRPGAVIVSTTSMDPNLEATTCRNIDGKFAVAVMNRTNNSINFKLKNGGQMIRPTIAPHSIMTFIF